MADSDCILLPHNQAWAPSGERREAVCCCSSAAPCLNVPAVPEESPPAMVLHELRSFLLLQKGWFLQMRQEGAHWLRTASHLHSDHSLRVSAPFSGPNLICSSKSLIQAVMIMSDVIFLIESQVIGPHPGVLVVVIEIVLFVFVCCYFIFIQCTEEVCAFILL